MLRTILIVAVVLASGGLVMASAVRMDRTVGRRRDLLAVLATAAFVLTLMARPASLVVSGAAVLAAAVAVAPWLGRSLGSLGAIVTFAITVSIVDVLSFGGGLTRQMIQDFEAGSSSLLRFLALSIGLDGKVVSSGNDRVLLISSRMSFPVAAG